MSVYAVVHGPDIYLLCSETLLMELAAEYLPGLGSHAGA